MKVDAALSGIQPHRLVFVQPSSGHQWQVVVEGREQPAQFADRERALSYAQIWAAVNQPSTIIMYSTASASRA